MLALAHSGSLDLPFLIPFGFFFPVVRLVDEVLGGDSSYSRCRFPSAEIPIPANTPQPARASAAGGSLGPCHRSRRRTAAVANPKTVSGPFRRHMAPQPSCGAAPPARQPRVLGRWSRPQESVSRRAGALHGGEGNNYNERVVSLVVARSTSRSHFRRRCSN